MGGDEWPVAADQEGDAIEVTLLGEVTVGVGGAAPATIARRQDRLVFARLVQSRGTPIASDVIASMLWGDEPPETWRTALRGVLSRLTRAARTAGITDLSIKNAGGQVWMTFSRPYRSDIERAADLLADANGVHGGPTHAIESAAAAVNIFERPFLADWDGPWPEGQRVWIGDRLQEALRIEAGLGLDLGDATRSLHAARRVLLLDPFDESAHRLVIRAHALQGDRSAALAAYETCRAVLRDGLGCSPAPETEALHLDLLAAEPSTVRIPQEFPFVGREAERARMTRAWRHAVDGRAQMLIIAGDSGIGKSRLASEMATSFQSVGAIVLYGRSDPTLPLPYRPIGDALSDYVDLRGVDRLVTLGSVTADLERLWPRLVDHLPAGHSRHDAVPVNAESALLIKWRVFDAVAQWIRAISADEPTVLLLDDLQWAQVATVELLSYVMSECDRARVLFVATYRPGQGSAPEHLRAVADLLALPAVDQISLSGLSTSDIATLVGESIEHKVDSASEFDTLAEEICEKTKGNALLATELVRRIGRDAASAKIEGQDRAPFVVSPSALDATMATTIATRLEAMDSSHRSVITLAALAGSRTSQSLLGAAMGSPELVDEAIRVAIADGLVVWNDGEVEFIHELVRNAVISVVAPDERRRLHMAIAIAAAEDPAIGDVSIVAQHGFDSIASDVDDQTAEMIMSWCSAAARQAFEQIEFDAAASWYGKARSVLAHIDPTESRTDEWCDLRISEGEALHAAGSADYKSVLALAIADARRLGDPVRMARAALAFAEIGISQTLPQDATLLIAALQFAIGSLPAEPVALRIKVLAALALESRWIEGPEVQASMLMQLERLGPETDDPGAQASAMICRAELADIDASDRVVMGSELQRLAGNFDSATTAAWASVVAFDALIEMVAVGEATEQLELLERIVKRVQMPYLEWTAMTRRAGFLALIGDHDQALSTMEQASMLGREIGVHPGIVSAGSAGLALTVALETEELGQAVDLLHGLEPMMGGQPFWHASMAAALAEGGGQSVERHLDVVIDAVDPDSIRLLDVSVLVNAARAASRIGDERIGSYVSALELRSGRFSWASCVSFGPIDLALGWIGRAMGDLASARSHFVAAKECAQRAGLPNWAARAVLELSASPERPSGRGREIPDTSPRLSS